MTFFLNQEKKRLAFSECSFFVPPSGVRTLPCVFEVITKGDFYCTAAAHYLHEELGAVRVFSTIGHREQKCSVVFQGEFFVCKTPDRVGDFVHERNSNCLSQLLSPSLHLPSKVPP